MLSLFASSSISYRLNGLSEVVSCVIGETCVQKTVSLNTLDRLEGGTDQNILSGSYILQPRGTSQENRDFKMAESELSPAELNEQRFKELNLQEDVLAQYRKRFDALDLNKDGIVELREFAAVSRIFGYNLSKDAIMEIFGRKDIDDTGGITFVEFVVAMRRRAGKNQATGDIRGKFRQYDVKNRGYITADEAFPVLERELGFDLSKTEALVEKYDKNRDYRLSLLEFVEFQKKVEELKEQIVQAFYEFDTNSDGYVGLDEVNAKMLPKGCTPQQVDALFRQADKDQDNQLNYSEFAAFWDIPIN